MTRRMDAIQRFAAEVKKSHGNSVFGFAHQARRRKTRRISTGSLALDFATGGGIPAGRTTMIFGQQSSGKSTQAYRIAGIGQKLCANCLRPASELEVVEVVADADTGEVVYLSNGKCTCFAEGLYEPTPEPKEKEDAFAERCKLLEANSYEEFRVALVDMEGSLDEDWAKKVGLDTKTLLYVIPDTAEEVIDIYDSLLRTGTTDMIILDSIAAMTPSAEIEESAEDWQQGLQARLVNKFVRKVQSSSNAVYGDYGKTPTHIWINQVRTNIAAKYGDKSVLPGGRGQRFATAVEIKMWPSDWKKDDTNTDLDKQHHGMMGKEVRLNFKIEKNKTSAAQGEGGYVLTVAGPKKGDIDEFGYVVQLCEKYGFIRKESGNKWFLGEEQYKTKGDMLSRLEDPDVYAQLRGELLTLMLGEV